MDKKTLELIGDLNYVFNTKFISQHIGRVVTAGEVGCTLSHIKAWKLISENDALSDNEFGLVAEDDVKLIDDFSFNLIQLLPAFIQMDVDIILLQRLYWEQLYQGKEFQGFFPKKSYQCDDACSGLYLIRKSKTKELVERLNHDKPFWLADEFSLFCNLDKIFVGQTLFGYVPEDMDSDLEADRNIARQHSI